ncbi:MAG: hypothetical protein DRM99_02875, partial [Thermoplasmata archaeon]
SGVIKSPNIIIKSFRIMGERKLEFIWYWTKGDSRVYTRKTEIAERAMKEGKLVMGKRVKPSIIKY